MQVNDIIHNFKLLQIKDIPDYKSTMYVFSHLKSNGTLVYLENDDNNKCFAYGFKTIPENDTGIAHIIEHSLLCGSKKYPLKEPFVNLIKGSMATFLNAFTADDFTMYPVASLNDNDFDNLMSVYLDAIFAPLSIVDIKPFLQEGWHYELNNIDDSLTIKGVVYNEMKGATSTVDSILSYFANSQIYKGSNYQYNSGGDPEEIPNLTYTYYKEFYKKHYHPSNGLIYLYGNMDITKKLKFIDKEYLSKFDNNVEKVTINDVKPIINKDATKYYPINKNEELKNNTYFAMSFALCKNDKSMDLKALNVINRVLMGSNDSYLKKALLNASIGQDVSSYINDSAILPTYNIFLKKSNIECKEKFYQVFMDTLKEVTKNGLDKKALLATINNAEFTFKEMDVGNTPKGLLLAFDLMSCFNYNLPFESALEQQKDFDILRSKIDTGYFESLIEKYFLNSNHYTLVTLLPSNTLQEENEKKLANKLADIKASMTKDELENLLKQNVELNEYQSHVDTKEELATLPSLKLNQISYSVPKINTKIVKKENTKYIYHNVDTNGIGYLKMYFEGKVIKYNDLPYVEIISCFLKSLDTTNYKANELLSYIKTYLGSLFFSSKNFSNSKNNFEYRFVISCSVLKNNISYVSKIINEIIDNTFYDENKMKTILLQQENNLKDYFMTSASATITENRKYHSKIGSINCRCNGYDYYKFIKNLNKHFDYDKFTLKLKEVLTKLFNKNNLVVSISGDTEIISSLENEVNNLHMNNQINKNVLRAKTYKKENSALVIPSLVNYDSEVTNLEDLGYQKDGHLFVLNHIIRYDYLWNQIRVKGGAYGTNISSYNNNDIILSSYRDPNVKNTFEAFENLYQYVANLNLTDDELKTYIIGSVGNYDPVGSINYLIVDADNNYFNKKTYKAIKQRKKEILTTTLEDLHKYDGMFKEVASNATKFTIGNEKQIKDANIFTKINKL